MTLTTSLRVIAIAMALTGLVDPSWSANRDGPVAVELRVSTEPGSARAAEAVAERLRLALDGDVAFNSDGEPAAVVLVGTTALSEHAELNTLAPGHPGTGTQAPRHPATPASWQGPPVSTVSLPSVARPNVRIVSVIGPRPVPPAPAAHS